MLAAAAACAHRPEVFFFQYGAAVRELCAPNGTRMNLRQIAEELEGCYFDERCEAALCSRIYQPAAVQPVPPTKPGASNWLSPS